MTDDKIKLVALAMRHQTALSFTDQLAVVAALNFCRTAASSEDFAEQYGTIAQTILTTY